MSAALVVEVGGGGSAKRPRLEINKTYEIIREGFEGQAHAPLKMSLKGDHVEVAFISPVIGERYRERLDALEGVTGWPLRVRAQMEADFWEACGCKLIVKN